MQTPISSDATVSWHPEHMAAEIDGQVVLMSVAEGKYVGLDDIASAVWRRLDTPVRVAALCEELARDYDGDPAVISHDVAELLARLAELGLIDVERGSAA